MRKLALTLCLAGIVAVVVLAQEKDPTFEGASVKANKTGDSNGNLQGLPGGRINARNMQVRPIITFAYQLAQYQLVGGPGWLATDRAPPVDPNVPSFFTAVQEQLGLELEPTKGPVEVLVIDGVEKPTED